ncbi:MAG: deoxyribose-phosphate aldolase [Peptoniphilus sp.]|uniref:deoxyribose-phosphate aldolase n=1 Tax=Peptoniphilus sp. TaxID=1971214 RepID=UPI0025E5F44E|nr:deoxyribose-phosphate aldolase [Peptoniphilus sp.]MCI5642648.1 deoxyribose-phosphate aldolase [Peptoniphilus sp.]MDD7352734.1 deoxyribose-phosphate aldolase [Peptoniphilaceae bacterium]MDY3903338.1 deoxyribose-phosphate aldolase [Peptoniphilus sp.]
MEINRIIDHTLLKPESAEAQIEEIVREAIEYNFFSVCVNPIWVKKCAEMLKNSSVKVCTVIGFPLGANTLETKLFETKNAIENGADEIDMVINIGYIKSKKFTEVEDEIREIAKICHDNGKILKVILENCLLTKDEIKKACELSDRAGADFVKTSTGFSTSGANSEDVKLMKDSVSDRVKVKASGGIRDYKKAIEMINNGADRLGVSAGVAIYKESKLL